MPRPYLIASLAALAWNASSAAQETLTTSGPIAPLWQARYDFALPKNERAVALRSSNGRLYSLALSTSAQTEPLFVVTASDGVTHQELWQSSCSGPTFAFAEPVGDLEVAPDGSRVYVASSRDANFPEAVVTVFDGATGTLVAVWQHGTPLVGFQRALVSADGARLYAIGMSPVFAAPGIVCAFSTATGQVLWSQSFPLGINQVAPDLELSADGLRLITSTENGVDAYATANGALLWSRAGATYDLALQPTLGVVARARQGSVELLSELAGAVLATIPFASSTARAVAFEPGGFDLAVARVPTSGGAGEIARYSLQGVKAWGQSLAAATQPRRIEWTGGVAPTLWLAGDAAGGAFLRTHDPATGVALENQTFASNGDDPALVAGPLDGFAAFAYSKQGEHLDASVSIYSPMLQLASSATIALDAPAAEEMLGAAVNADGSALIVASAASAGATRLALRRIDAATGALQWQTEVLGLDAAPQLAPQAPATGSRRFAVSSNGVWVALAAWNDDAAALLFANAQTGAHGSIAGATLHDDAAIHDVVAVPDSGFAAVESTNASVGTYLFDAQLFPLFNGLEGPALYDPEHPARIEPTPDGTRVLIAYTEQNGNDLDIALKLRNTANGALVWSVDLDHPAPTVPLEVQQLNALAIAPDGARAFVVARLTNAPLGAPRQALTAIDLSTGAPLWSVDFDTTHGYAHALAVRPDGAQLALADRPEPYGPLASIRAFATSSGQLDWSTPLGSSGIGAHRVRYDATGAKVYAGTSTPLVQGFPYPPAGHGVRAYRALDGTSAWSFEVDTSDALPELVNAIVETSSPRRLFAVGSNAVNGAPTDAFVRALDLPELTQDADQLSVGAGGTLGFDLDAGTAFAGDLAWLVGSASGTTPGLVVDGLLLPLVPDAYFAFFVTTPNQGYLHGTLGGLDVYGHRNASIALPAGSSAALAGLVLNHAYVAIDLSLAQVVLASNALAVTLVP